MPRARLRAGTDAPACEPPDETLAGFSDWREIGRGGDATVYRAIQDSLGREVAIKVLTVDDQESIRRFTREVQLMVSLGRQHPNIANVLQIGTSNRGRPCIVMDYYELGSLDKRLTAYGRLNPDEVVGVGLAMSSALSFAHGKGVLHRDVKPQNILMLPTTYVLADFGIARLIDSAHTASSDRFSYRHASPQVLDGSAACESDDIWSLGATLYHLLDGQPPFTTGGGEPDGALSYIHRVREERPRPLTRPDIPPELVEVVDRALNKDPAGRYASAAAFHNALARVEVAPGPHPGTAPAREPWVHDASQATADLTWVRLHRSREAASPATGDPPPAAERHSGGGLSYLLLGLGGALLGILLVAIAALINGPADRRPVAMAPAVVSPTPLASPRVNDSRLRPQQLQVRPNEHDPSKLELTWQRPADVPEGYAITLRNPSEPTGKVVATPGPDATGDQLTLAPEQTKICVGVTGLLPSQDRFGAEEICIDR